MNLSIIAIISLIVIVIIIKLTANYIKALNSGTKKPNQYKYMRKQFIMTMSEKRFYEALQEAIGTAYMIYPQAHFDLFLDHKVKGQNWRGALSTIQRKSVDFLICSRHYYSPLVAIELDDSSHLREDRAARDEKVEEICKSAGMPLVRFKATNQYSPNELLEKLAPYLK